MNFFNRKKKLAEYRRHYVDLKRSVRDSRNYWLRCDNDNLEETRRRYQWYLDAKSELAGFEKFLIEEVLFKE